MVRLRTNNSKRLRTIYCKAINTTPFYLYYGRHHYVFGDKQVHACPQNWSARLIQLNNINPLRTCFQTQEKVPKGIERSIQQK